MLRIALQGLRGRKGPFAGAFVALAVAAALVMACATLTEAGLRSAPAVERYIGAPIVAAGHQQVAVDAGTENADAAPLFERARVPAALASRLAGVPGVRAAIADVSAPAALRGPSGAATGPAGHPIAVHPWDTAALTPYTLRSGRAPAGARELVVDAGIATRGRLRVGQRVELSSTGPVQSMTVVGIAATAAAVTHQGVLFVTRAEAERLAATPGRVDAIGILPARGADLRALAERVRAVAGRRLRVVTGGGRGEVEHIESIEARASLLALCGTFGGLALLIAMFVVASTIGLAVMQRQREVALLRAIAATPRQVRWMIAWEALVVGLIAAAAGVGAGLALARALGRALAQRGIAPEDLHVAAGIVPVIVTVFGTALTALVAVLAAGRRAARVHPTQALQECALEPNSIGVMRFGAGVIALGGAGVLVATSATSRDPNVAADTATVSAFLLILATSLLGPIVVRLATGIAGRAPGRATGEQWFLALANVRTSPRRFASATTPLVLCVAMSCLLLFLATTRQHATSEQAGSRVIADLVVQSGGIGIPAAAVDDMRRITGVQTAVGVASTTLGPTSGARYGQVPAAIVDPRGVDDVLDLDVRSGSLADLGDTAIALSTTQATAAHAAIGHRVSVTLGDGTRRTARVAAVYRRALGFGDVLLPSAMVSGHRTSPLVDGVLIRTAPGARPDDVAARVRSLLGRYPGLSVGDRHDLAVQADADREATDWLFRMLVAVIFAFTAIAVVNTLMMIGLHRSRELALLRLVGTTARQVRGMARREAVMVVALGLVLGGAIALVALMPTSSIISGSAIPYAPARLLALVLGSAAAVGLGGSEIAARLALRARPVDAIGLRD